MSDSIATSEPEIPLLMQQESDFVAQRQQAIRLGQGGVLLLIFFAVATFLLQSWQLCSTWQLVTLLVVALCFAVCSLWGTRRINQYFQQGIRAEQIPDALLGGSRLETLLHFTALYTLSLLLYVVAVDVGEVRSLWLFLLVPIGHAVLFLPIWATAITYVLSISILLISLGLVEGFQKIPVPMMQFSLAAVFVFVFARIAASAERGRAEVAIMAAELKKLNRQISQYSIQAEELAVSRERNELARNIHDSVGHVLTAVNIQLRAAAAVIDQDLTGAKESIDRAQELSVSGLAEIRSSVSALRTSPLAGKTLHEAIEHLMACDSSFGFQTELSVQGTPRAVSSAVALAIYRATQEGMTNVRKHSDAKNVNIELDFRSSDSVKLTLFDDGSGAETFSGGFGLLGLRERAELLGGNISIINRANRGVQLEMRLPT